MWESLQEVEFTMHSWAGSEAEELCTLTVSLGVHAKCSNVLMREGYSWIYFRQKQSKKIF
jgi:hypothetical protein